jgi:hypothetical protein
LIVLDENILAGQRLALAAGRFHLCQIGQDVGRKGMPDDQIIALLRQIRRPTLFSRDKDFFQQVWCADTYCLAHLDVAPLDVAHYARRLLRHPDFRTWSQRRGCVVRVSASGITVWHRHARRPVRHAWPDRD